MRNARMLFFALVVLATVPVLTVCAITGTSESDTKEASTKLEIRVGGKTFTAVLYDNASTDAFLQKLPLALDMSELNGNEKYFYLSERLPANSQRVGSIKNGDLMLYGSDCLVLFYESFSTSYSYTKLGYVTDATGLAGALGSGSVKVSFRVAKKRVASDNAVMQTANKKMPTRVIKNGTKITMRFGNTVIPGILNNSETAKALIARLPYTVHVSRYSHDFCGVMNNPLPYSESNVHFGWLNGDIDFARDANYFTILFEDEKKSEQYGHQINIGVIDCELSRISNLRGSYDVLIELAK